MVTESFESAKGDGEQSVDGMVRALNEANRRLMAATTEDEVASVLSDVVTDVLDFPGTGVRLYDPERGALVTEALGSTVNDIETRPPYDVDDSPHGRAFREGETVVDDIDEDDRYDRNPFVQTIHVPVGGYGVLSAGKLDEAFTGTEVRIAEILARNASVAFDRAAERRDLTRSLERLEAQNERLERLASVVTHDIRNPLNVARGKLDLLKSGEDPDAVDDIERTLHRMERLVDEVLTLVDHSDVEARERIVLSRLAERCWDGVDTDGARLVVDRDATFRGDPSRLRHVFENLFRNAVEHGSATDSADGDTPADREGDDCGLTVRVGGTETGFYVEDDGCGIPDTECDRVFESGYTTAADGTGFGLAIVADMVDAHGWSVSITEGRDGGARFEITGVETATPQ